MPSTTVSKAVMRRLPLYYAYLKELTDEEGIYISATAVANALELGEVQVRKDLALISGSGRPKRGYPREVLVRELEEFLGYNSDDNAVLVGAGKLGQALLDYTGFREYGLNVQAAFDIFPAVDVTQAGKPILPMERLEAYIHANRIRIAIITVPAEAAQMVCDQLIQCGILAILNFAPVRLEVPENILVQNENLAMSLAVISRHVQATLKERM